MTTAENILTLTYKDDSTDFLSQPVIAVQLE